MPTGARYGRFRYRIAGKDTRLAFGVYPEVTLAEARARRDDARRLLREGGDPAGERRSARLTAKLAAGTTFEGVAREWLATQKRKLTPATYDKAERILKANVFPWLGARPIGAIDAPAVLAVLTRNEARGPTAPAHRAKAPTGQVFPTPIPPGTAAPTRSGAGRERGG